MCCQNSGPGPAYGAPSLVGYYDHDITRKRWPAYSMGIRPQTKVTVTPGPYSTDVQKNPHAGFTIGIKPLERKIAQSAGPADYFPQEKSKPGFTIAGRHDNSKLNVSPGPAAYFYQPVQNKGFHIANRHPVSTYVTPGPYGVVDMNVYKNRAPRSPIGVSNQVHKPSLGPGPGAFYPLLPDKAPAYSFGMKHHPCSRPLLLPSDNV